MSIGPAVTMKVAVPLDLAASLSLPRMSLTSGTTGVEMITVRCLGEPPIRKSVLMTLPFDSASAITVHRTVTMQRVRRYLLRPLVVFTALSWVVVGLAFLLPRYNDRDYPIWVIVPFLAAVAAVEIWDILTRRQAVPQHPRRERAFVTMANIPEAVATEIVRSNPGVMVVS